MSRCRFARLPDPRSREPSFLSWATDGRPTTATATGSRPTTEVVWRFAAAVIPPARVLKEAAPSLMENQWFEPVDGRRPVPRAELALHPRRRRPVPIKSAPTQATENDFQTAFPDFSQRPPRAVRSRHRRKGRSKRPGQHDTAAKAPPAACGRERARGSCVYQRSRSRRRSDSRNRREIPAKFSSQAHTSLRFAAVPPLAYRGCGVSAVLTNLEHHRKGRKSFEDRTAHIVRRLGKPRRSPRRRFPRRDLLRTRRKSHRLHLQRPRRKRLARNGRELREHRPRPQRVLVRRRRHARSHQHRRDGDHRSPQRPYGQRAPPDRKS